MREAVGWGCRRAIGALGAALALGTGAARAEPPAAWLAWRAPIECQNTSEVERRLSSLLGHAVEASALPPTQVLLGWNGERGWSVRVRVQLEGGPRERALDAPTCADAFDVIALSLALLLDPAFADAAAEDPDAWTGAGLAEGGGPASGATGADGAAEGAVPLLSDGAGQHDAEQPPAEAASFGAPPGAEAPPQSSQRSASGSGRPTLVVALGPLTDLGTFPVPQFGGGLLLGLVSGAMRAELEGDALASESTRFRGAEHPVSFYSLHAGLRGCYGLAASARLTWVACAGAELGTLGTRESGGEARQAQGLWLAAEMATGPEVAATTWLRAFARARLVSPLIRREFLLSEGARVHALPWLSPQLHVGVAVDVTELGGAGH